eukprot:scaffold344442_cov41-Prasinocladus_malaysianus.AAC.1
MKSTITDEWMKAPSKYSRRQASSKKQKKQQAKSNNCHSRGSIHADEQLCARDNNAASSNHA